MESPRPELVRAGPPELESAPFAVEAPMEELANEQSSDVMVPDVEPAGFAEVSLAVDLTPPAIPHGPRQPAARLAGVLRGARVVVVGANEAVVAIETRLLQAAAATVSTFDAWQPALHFADSTPPDLLVLNPSTSDGWTAMTAFAWLLVNRPELRSRTLLTLSVRDPETDAFCSQYATHYLFHPFDPSEFFAAVQRTIKAEQPLRVASGI